MAWQHLGLPQFPSAVGFTWLRVYDSVAPDGVRGGSPHVHLASTKAYVTVAGHGEVHTLGPDGFGTLDLRPGAVVWFEPGIIHRLVNTSSDLEIFVVMQNNGLPEAGDAVLTVPEVILTDPDTYRSAAGPEVASAVKWPVDAAVLRNLAVEGFTAMLDADDTDRLARYERFLKNAVSLRRDPVSEWRQLWQERPLAEAQRTGERLDEIEVGAITALMQARVASYMPKAEPAVGMCGQLDTYLPEGWTH
ncbi:MAG TPA: hypothetical protein VGR29_08110 [Thermomicrobiales bacterium]|nr:hypothetical protein [Thermomicrobiales bacterium]